jgi:hypothetical protein
MVIKIVVVPETTSSRVENLFTAIGMERRLSCAHQICGAEYRFRVCSVTGIVDGEEYG